MIRPSFAGSPATKMSASVGPRRQRLQRDELPPTRRLAPPPPVPRHLRPCLLSLLFRSRLRTRRARVSRGWRARGMVFVRRGRTGERRRLGRPPRVGTRRDRGLGPGRRVRPGPRRRRGLYLDDERAFGDNPEMDCAASSSAAPRSGMGRAPSASSASTRTAGARDSRWAKSSSRVAPANVGAVDAEGWCAPALSSPRHRRDGHAEDGWCARAGVVQGWNSRSRRRPSAPNPGEPNCKKSRASFSVVRVFVSSMMTFQHVASAKAATLMPRKLDVRAP